MKLVFVSNYFNHHQKPLSDCFFKKYGNDYYFIANSTMSDERRKMGYAEIEIPSYVKYSYTSREDYQECLSLVNDADAVIYGFTSCPREMIEKRIKENKLTFRYSERIFKEGLPWLFLPKRIVTQFLKYGNRKSHFLLTASAYAYSDFRKLMEFKNKAFKFGYFPETKIYENSEEILKNKCKNSILWCGRFLDWKHPEIAVLIAEELKKRGCNFHLTMIGGGAMEEEIKSLVKNKRLSDHVSLTGSISPAEVRSYMEKSEVFLFTSNQKEGWGAVLNESMNSLCVPIANKNIGSVPYLLNDQNGIGYDVFDLNKIVDEIVSLFENKEQRERIAINAYKTITEVWSAKNAADSFELLVECIKNNKEFPYKDGPCSRAQILNSSFEK